MSWDVENSASKIGISTLMNGGMHKWNFNTSKNKI